MDFVAKNKAVTEDQWIEIAEFSPAESKHRQGFKTSHEELERTTALIRDLESRWISAKPEWDGRVALDYLECVIRLLQMGLEVQNSDYEDLEEENAALKDTMESLEDEIAVFKRNMEEEDGLREKLRLEKEDYQQKIEGLEKQLSSAEEAVLQKQSELESTKQKLLALHMENEDIRNEVHTLSMYRQTSDAQGEMKIRDALKQRDVQIDQILSDNKDLQDSYEHLQEDFTNLKKENLEVSGKIVLLDEDTKQLRIRNADLEVEAERLAAMNHDLSVEKNNLESDIQTKVQLLQDFESRFEKQFSDWEAEKSKLQDELKTLLEKGVQPEASGQISCLQASHDSQASQDQALKSLRDDLLEEKEKQILLLEAYEQLEIDVDKEVQNALAEQGTELKKVLERNHCLENVMKQIRIQASEQEDVIEKLQTELELAQSANQSYEKGIYGLPEAVNEIKQLKAAVLEGERNQESHVQTVNKTLARLEDLADENKELRKRAGIEESSKIDTLDIRLEREMEISQLRSLASHLESDVWVLEEERRKLKSELRFRAKYHGQHALDMGLSGEQLLMVENYVEQIKHKKGSAGAEAKIVGELQSRIRFLEGRLGAIQAFDDMPPGSRPQLIEAREHADRHFEEKILQPINAAIQILSNLVARTGQAK